MAWSLMPWQGSWDPQQFSMLGGAMGGKSRVKGGRDASMVSLLGREATKRLRKTAQQRNLAC